MPFPPWHSNENVDNDNNLSFLTFTSHIDCTITDFRNSHLFDIHFDIIGLEETYPPGREIVIPCKTGYNGFFKIACGDSGQWRKAFGGVCEGKFILVSKNLEYIFYVAILKIGNIFTQIL